MYRKSIEKENLLATDINHLRKENEMKMNHQFNIVSANNGFCLNIRDQDSYNQDTFVFKTWEELLTFLKDNEEYQVTEQVREEDKSPAQAS